MGQKVHPLGFRVGITKKHQSQWFARFNKYAYSQSVVEDHMLRKTLMTVLPELLNPVLKKSQKADNTGIVPKITQIKIERALIPYEIGIQIHAENCDVIKSAFDNLKINREMLTNLQKTRQYLSKVVSPSQSAAQALIADTASSVGETKETADTSNKKRTVSKALASKARRGNQRMFGRGGAKKGGKFAKGRFSQRKGSVGVKAQANKVLKIKNLKKRLKKRQAIRNRYLQFLSKGLFIRKTGNTILRKVSCKGFVKKARFKAATKLNKKPLGKVAKGRVATQKAATSMHGGLRTTSRTGFAKKLSNKLSKKFATLFMNKVNKKFLLTLKSLMKFWHNQANSGNKQAPIGLNPKWSTVASDLSKLKTLKTKPVAKLTTLVEFLEKKSLQKLDTLRKDFMTFGTISKTRSLGYYQLITFLKHLKELVNKLKKQNKTTTKKLSLNKKNLLVKANLKTSVTQTVFNKVVNNLDKETRKIQFVNYFQNMVRSYRQANIFYYLSSMAVASKNLKQLKRYTKAHSSFLFGLDSNNLHNVSKQALQDKIEKVLVQANKNQTLEKNLQEGFLEQIENQRKMYQANLALTPKISLKFFSVKTENVLEKASVVADSIVDALEKRKAFRGVIKKAKEDLMRRSRVKGVKIQVAGRLNGAEIARSEWVRAGRVPLQTLRANIDYSYRTASTIYGIIGVKVWIFKGQAS